MRVVRISKNVGCVSLFFLVFASSLTGLARAEAIELREVTAPLREAVHGLSKLHAEIDRRAAGDARMRIVSAYLWHMIQESRALLDATSGRTEKRELLDQAAHLEGWFEYTESKLNDPIIEEEVRQDWRTTRRAFTESVSLILRRVEPGLESISTHRQSLEPSARDALGVPSSFERVVSGEQSAGKVSDPHGAWSSGEVQPEGDPRGKPLWWPKRPWKPGTPRPTK